MHIRKGKIQVKSRSICSYIYLFFSNKASIVPYKIIFNCWIKYTTYSKTKIRNMITYHKRRCSIYLTIHWRYIIEKLKHKFRVSHCNSIYWDAHQNLSPDTSPLCTQIDHHPMATSFLIMVWLMWSALCYCVLLSHCHE